MRGVANNLEKIRSVLKADSLEKVEQIPCQKQQGTVTKVYKRSHEENNEKGLQELGKKVLRIINTIEKLQVNDINREWKQVEKKEDATKTEMPKNSVKSISVEDIQNEHERGRPEKMNNIKVVLDEKQEYESSTEI
ncbi:hypothetical protein Trydic_g6951 [Trypoxylus dichotomus]